LVRLALGQVLRRVALMLSFVAVLAMAGEGAALAGTLTAPNNSSSFPHQSISRDAPVGFLVKTPSLFNNFVAEDVTCKINATSTVSGTLVPGYTDMFKSNIDGIGIKFRYLGFTSGLNAPATESRAGTGAGTVNIPMFRDAQIWVYGPVAMGTTTTAALPAMTLTYSGDCFPTVTSVWTIDSDLSVTSQSCTVTTPSADVILPKIATSALPSNGSTAGATPIFIGLNCAAIGKGKVYVTLTDKTTPTNRSNLLSLSPASTAQGVRWRGGRTGVLGPGRRPWSFTCRVQPLSSQQSKTRAGGAGASWPCWASSPCWA